MFPEDKGPAETAIDFTDQYVDAGLAKLDALFGAGFVKQNPQALAAYIATCAANLNAMMTAATAIDDDDFDEALAVLEDILPPEPPVKPRGRRR